jgi:hypothetical protein
MKRKKGTEKTDKEHFERLWKIIPDGSPLHAIGAERLHDCIFPIDRHTLIQIDPTRKHPYSLVFAEYFSPHTDVFFKEKIDEHQIWLLKNSSDGFKVFQKQKDKCESNLECPDVRAKGVADIIEYQQNVLGGETSREAVRDIARVDNTKLFPKDTTIENRDQFNRIEKIYEKTQKSKAGRPHKKMRKKR